MNVSVSCSLVLYKTDKKDIIKIIKCLSNEKIIDVIYVIDNSPFSSFFIIDNINLNNKIIYIHNPKNPGFGAAHNIAIKQTMDLGFKYHFVVNPDIYLKEDVIFQMIDFMEKDTAVGMMMPQILNLDGTIQNLPKLLPSPMSILLRKVKRPKKLYDKFINKYELRTVKSDQIYNTPILSGCFTLLNLKAIEKVGGYDDKYFMYFEDWDLSRRVHQHFKTVYFPKVSVYHGYDSGANNNIKLFKIFLKSAMAYFNKWGWFFDEDRSIKNKKTLLQFNEVNSNRG